MSTVEKYKEALTPSGDTKADYIGEFSFEIDGGGRRPRSVMVPWTTVKEIMQKIKDRAERDDFSKMSNGLYRVYWESGGCSLAAVLIDREGQRVLAPINWVTTCFLSDHASGILKMEKLDIPVEG